MRQSIQITIYRAKAKQTKRNKLCLSKKKKNPNTKPLYQNGKAKPKPQYSLLGRRNLPIVVVVVAVARPSSSPQLAPHRKSQIVDGRSQSQSLPSSQIDLLSSGPPVLSSPLAVTVGASGAQLKVFLISLSFSLSISLSLSH